MSRDNKISLTASEAFEAAGMIDFCIANQYCLGMDFGVAEDGGKTKFLLKMEALLEKLEDFVKAEEGQHR